MFGLLGEKGRRIDFISDRDVVMVLAAFTLLVLPHLSRLPLLVSGYIALLVAGRFGLSHFGRRLPGWRGKAVLIIGGILALWGGLGWQFTVNAAVAFFTISICLKLFELKFYRDLYSYVLLLIYFMATAFLFDQTLFTLLYLLGCILWVFYLLLSIHTSKSAVSFGFRVKKTGVILLQALPVMIVLFLFFPRISPLWSVPLNSGQARTGISDTMSPGDISQLAQSDARAFRVEFQQEIPEKKSLYWRGLILDQFDGRAWSASEIQPYAPIGKIVDVRLDDRVSEAAYKVIIEPTEKRWAFALENSVPASSNIRLSDEGLIRFQQNIFQATLYQADIRDVGQAEEDKSIAQLRRYQILPRSRNPQTREFGRELWQQSGKNAERYLGNILEFFQREGFQYTLRPPENGEQAVDDFLFSSRQGFCAHYAGSFAFLARLAGIPARVIVGYQGGDLSQDGSYLVVHQFDAHAWVEVWLAGKGWVRIDPTAYVAPARIDTGIREAVREEGSFLEKNAFSASRFAHIGVVNWLRWQLDAVNYNWQKWVVGYNEEIQSSVLTEWFNNDSLLFMAGALVGLSVVAFLALYGWSYIRTRKQAQAEEVKLYLAFCAALKPFGVERLITEGPRDFADRAKSVFPEGARVINEVTNAFVALRYSSASPAGNPNALTQFRRQVSQGKKQLRQIKQKNTLRKW